ncbi:histidine kinase [Kribbella sp. NPDC056861]|uniref:sensor histidine kinase n=1 Tax=Kribbella sp. NPDC056861 TaxID=3154857 RepID=UPI00342CAE1C
MSSRWPIGRAGVGATVGVAALLVLTVADLGQHYQLPLGAAFALGVVRALSLALVWLKPSAVLPLSLAAAVLTAAVCVPISADEPWPWAATTVFGHSIVLALVGARGAPSARRSLVVWWVGTQVAGAVAMGVAPERGTWSGLLTMAVLSAVAVVVGELLRSRAEARRQLVEQEGISAAERAERARWQERARIARELHDVVAHHLSVVVVRADSAPHRLVALPADAREEFAGIAEDARSSLTEMRRVLRLLRAEPGGGGSSGELGPQPGLEDLDELVASTCRAGADVRLTVGVGELPGVVDPAVGLTVYRVVQEAVSNAVRHAPGAVVEVSVQRIGGADWVDGEGRGGLVVKVLNGPAALVKERDVGAPGSGHGVVGMKERVGLLGGEFAAGVTAEGGYLVEVRLPLDGEGKA